MRARIAYICEKPNHEVSYDRRLTIDDHEIKFFIEPVLSSSVFQQSEDQGNWCLQFFINSPFKKVLYVRMFEHDLGPEFAHPVKQELGRACNLDSLDNSAGREQVRSAASRFLRGSDTLKIDQNVKELAHDRQLITDKNGFAYFSSSPSQFKRLVLCHALVIAYTRVIDTSIQDLASLAKSKSEGEILTLYENVLRFNASDFFSLPVTRISHELYPAWTALSEHYALASVSDEFIAQISDIAKLLRVFEDRAAADRISATERREKARDRRLEFIGILLTICSVIIAVAQLFS